MMLAGVAGVEPAPHGFGDRHATVTTHPYKFWLPSQVTILPLLRVLPVNSRRPSPCQPDGNNLYFQLNPNTLLTVKQGMSRGSCENREFSIWSYRFITRQINLCFISKSRFTVSSTYVIKFLNCQRTVCNQKVSLPLIFSYPFSLITARISMQALDFPFSPASKNSVALTERRLMIWSIVI